MMLSGSPCNFYTWSRNSFVSPFADVFSIVAIKCAILLKWLHTTKIVLYPWAKGSLVIKSTDIWLHGFSGIALDISFPTGALL